MPLLLLWTTINTLISFLYSLSLSPFWLAIIPSLRLSLASTDIDFHIRSWFEFPYFLLFQFKLLIILIDWYDPFGSQVIYYVFLVMSNIGISKTCMVGSSLYTKVLCGVLLPWERKKEWEERLLLRLLHQYLSSLLAISSLP